MCCWLFHYIPTDTWENVSWRWVLRTQKAYVRCMLIWSHVRIFREKGTSKNCEPEDKRWIPGWSCHFLWMYFCTDLLGGDIILKINIYILVHPFKHFIFFFTYVLFIFNPSFPLPFIFVCVFLWNFVSSTRF